MTHSVIAALMAMSSTEVGLVVGGGFGQEQEPMRISTAIQINRIHSWCDKDATPAM